MKKLVVFLSMALCLLLAMPSCEGDGKSIFSPTSSGRPYEVLVVMDKNLWEEPAGRALYDVLDRNVPGLPQAERSFRISQIPPNKLCSTPTIRRPAGPRTPTTVCTVWQLLQLPCLVCPVERL